MDMGTPILPMLNLLSASRILEFRRELCRAEAFAGRIVLDEYVSDYAHV